MLSIKEIDKIFDNPKTKLVGDIIGKPWLCYAKTDIQEIRAQALVYVSLVEKIKKLEFEFISSSRNSSPTQSSNKGWNSALREIKSFIGET